MLFPPINPPEPTWLDGIGNLLLLGAGVAVAAFAFYYGFFFAWRITPAGRAVLYFTTGLVALLGHFILSRFMGGDYLFRDLIRAIVYGYLMVVSVRLLLTLRKIHKAGNHPMTAEELMLSRKERATSRKDRWERIRHLLDREPGVRS